MWFGEERYCFAKFDLAPLPNDVIRDNVVKATLKMWITRVSADGTVVVERVDEDWDEGTITANNAPSHSLNEGSFFVTSADVNTYLTVDITDLVKSWIDGDNHGFALVLDDGHKIRIGTKEGGRGMLIEVVLGESGPGGEEEEEEEEENEEPGPQGPAGATGPNRSYRASRAYRRHWRRWRTWISWRTWR